MQYPRFSGGLFVVAAALSIACAKETPVVEVAGACADAFTGQVCTWAHTKGDSLIDVGATVPIASIEKAPDGENMAWPPVAAAALAMPASTQAGSGMTEFTVNWEPTGHPPAPFLTPHFDLHFYLVPTATRTAITCADSTKPATLPAGYALPDQPLPPDMAKAIGVTTLIGVCVPQMGMHSLPATTLVDTTVFKDDMVIGYYAGKPIFIEPMVSRAMLMEKKSFDLTIPTIPGVSGNYPRTFHGTWDDAKQSYALTFSNFAAGS